MSTLKLDTLSNKAGTASVPSDTIVSGTAKAWVNFNGTGTVAIRRAFNVSSITDNGTGDFTLNFTNALVDANYSLVGVSSGINGVSYPSIVAPSLTTLFATTAARVQVAGSNGDITDVRDPSIVCVSVFS